MGLGDFLVGLVKSAIFGVIVAMSGCMRGMQCGRSAMAESTISSHSPAMKGEPTPPVMAMRRVTKFFHNFLQALSKAASPVWAATSAIPLYR